MYADDTKIYREIKSEYNHGILQRDLENLKTWSDRWLLKFHPSKCYYITIGQHNEEGFTYSMIEDGKKFDMTKVSEMKDIGVTVDSELKFDKHINTKIETANKILGIIRRSFIYLDADILLPLYKALVRSHFDYAMIIWNPHMVKHIESIERVQCRATKMIPELKHLSYPERLKKLKLPTMAYRRARGDMIEVFKIVAQIYDNKTTDNFLSFKENMNMSLRGHEFNYSMSDSFSRCKLHTSFCMSLYGSELWNYNSRYVEEIVVAWRKTMRKLFRLPYRTHNYIVCGITEDISIKLHRKLTLWNPRATTVDSPPFCRPDHGRPESTQEFIIIVYLRLRNRMRYAWTSHLAIDINAHTSIGVCLTYNIAFK